MSKPLYRQIADEIRARVLAGQFSDGKLPSEGMLVRRYGTTHVTVAKAMQVLEGEGLVIRRPGSGTFVKPSVEGAPVYVSTLIAGLGDAEFFGPISAQIAESCRTYGLNLVWGVKEDFNAFAPGASIAHLVEHYRRQNIRGVFFAPDAGDQKTSARNREVASALCNAGIQVVLIDRDITDFPKRGDYDLVGIDNLDAGHRQASHLIERGARRIVYAARSGSAWTLCGRIAGVRAACEDAGVPFGPEHVFATDDWSVKYLRSMLRKARPDGIVVFNDPLAAKILSGLAELKVRVPERVKVVGLDDMSAARYLAPPLTTLRQPVKSIGEEAARLMSLRLKHDPHPPRRIFFDVELIERKST